MYLFLFGTTTQKTEETDSHGSLPHCQSVRQRMGIVSNTTSSVRYQSTVRKHRQFCREEEAILIVQTPKQEKDSNLLPSSINYITLLSSWIGWWLTVQKVGNE